MHGRARGYTIGYEVNGRYRLEAFIGRGGMGEVWRAFDTELKRQVALKSAHTGDGRSAERLTRSMKREAQNAAQPYHANIVQVHDYVVEDATCWIVMEYVAGPSLAEIVADAPLSAELAAEIGRQIADALVALHAVGVVHGDLTPQNVLIAPDGRAKLTDFGISRAVWSETTVAGTVTNGVRGTPKYLPPELVDGGARTEKSDVFSLGATLYAAVEGRSPYGEADTVWTYLERARAGEIQPPHRAGPLAAVLAELLLREPARRPTAERARDTLSRIVPPAESAEGRPDDAVRNAGATGGTWTWTLRLRKLWGRAGHRPPWTRRRWRPRTVTGASLAVVAAIVLGYLLWPDHSGGDPGANGGDDPTTVSHPGVLGDPHTADPCQLLDPHAFARFGRSHLDPDYGELNRCDVLLEKDGSEAADIYFQLASDPGTPDSQSPTRKAGRLTVTEIAEQDDACERSIQLLDGNQIWLTARLTDPELGGSLPDLCTLADVATDHATDLLNRRAVPRRPNPFPTDSLARLHACEDLLDDHALEVIDGIDPQDAEKGFADWQCRWRSPSSHEGVQLLFNRDNDLSDDGQRVQLVPGVVSRIDPQAEGPHSCVVNTVRRVYTDSAGEHTVEYVALKTDGPQSAGRLCDDAKALGTSLAKKLSRL